MKDRQNEVKLQNSETGNDANNKNEDNTIQPEKEPPL
jgi:hypothetical protein